MFTQIQIPFIARIFIVPNVALRCIRCHLKVLDEVGNIGINEPLFVELIQLIGYEEGD
jgi:hypothetical protein